MDLVLCSNSDLLEDDPFGRYRARIDEKLQLLTALGNSAAPASSYPSPPHSSPHENTPIVPNDVKSSKKQQQSQNIEKPRVWPQPTVKIIEIISDEEPDPTPCPDENVRSRHFKFQNCGEVPSHTLPDHRSPRRGGSPKVTISQTPEQLFGDCGNVRLQYFKFRDCSEALGHIAPQCSPPIRAASPEVVIFRSPEQSSDSKQTGPYAESDLETLSNFTRSQGPKFAWEWQHLELLSVLMRWYSIEGCETPTSVWRAVAKILTRCFEEDLQLLGKPELAPRAVNSQFSDLRRHQSHPVWQNVFCQVEFGDTDSFWEHHQILKYVGGQLDLWLVRKVTEDMSLRKKIPHKIYALPSNRRKRDMMERSTGNPLLARLRAAAMAEAVRETVPEKTAAPSRLPGEQPITESMDAMNLDPPQQFSSSSSQNSLPMTLSPPSHSSYFHQIPPLAFREHDTTSAGLNGSDQFLAGQFVQLRSDSLPPMSKNDPALLPFVAGHLWGNKRDPSKPASSPLISITGSLIWAVYKACQRSSCSPRIAVISSGEIAKDAVYYVNNYLNGHRAKPDSHFQGMWYKGTQEWLVWGFIPAPAIVHDIPLERLGQLATRYPSVRHILRLDLLQEAKGVISMRRELAEERAIRRVDLDTAAAIALLAALFGFDTSSPAELVSCFVFNIVQNWILWPAREHIEEDELADTFAQTLANTTAYRQVAISAADEARINNAFAGGLEQGFAAVQREWNTSRKRKRT